MDSNKIEYDVSSLKDLLLETIVYDKKSSLTILVLNKNEKLKIYFDWIYAFSIIDEGDALKRLDIDSLTIGLYEYKNSSYLSWFHEQSFNIHVDEKIIHYVISTQNEIIDVLSKSNPKIDKV